MGLDMYLMKRHYISKYSPPEDQARVVGGNINPDRVRYITEEVGYWRKANAIHKWFVDNVQSGVDECQESYVGEEKLKELLAAVQAVKANHDLAPELLPTESGIFFGSTEYDEFYHADLDVTEQIIAQVLQEQEEAPGGEILYHSSW